MLGIVLALGGLILFAVAWGYLAHRTEMQSVARRTLIFDSRRDETRPPRPTKTRRPATPALAPHPDRPPALTAAALSTDDEAAIQAHAERGVADAQYMLDQVWQKKGHGQ